MPVTLQLPDVRIKTDDPTEGHFYFDMFGKTDQRYFWHVVLAMAVRDGASSVHYHPWRAMGNLTYLVDWHWYELVPPPYELAQAFALSAGSMICGNRLGAWSRIKLGWPKRTSGKVRCVSPMGEPTEWMGVVWSAGRHFGVEWFRLNLPTDGGPLWDPAAEEAAHEAGLVPSPV